MSDPSIFLSYKKHPDCPHLKTSFVVVMKGQSRVVLLQPGQIIRRELNSAP